MRKGVLVFLCLVLVAMIPTAFSAQGQSVTSGEYEYQLTEDGTAIVTKYLGSMAEVTIPASLDGIAVTIIGKQSFIRNVDITGVTIPEDVRTIEAAAFSNCRQLANVMLPESLETLGDDAFYSCRGLTVFTIPSGVVNIGNGTFGYCVNLTEYVVSQSNQAYHVRDGVLFNAAMDTLVSFPCAKPSTSYEIPEGTLNIAPDAFSGSMYVSRVTLPASMTRIGDYAFYNSGNITAIEISEGITEIGENAFAVCRKLTEIVIPDSVTNIADYAFNRNDSLMNIHVSPGNPLYASWNGILLDKAMSTILTYPGGRSEERIDLPLGITAIGEGAFASCRLLRQIEIPVGVTSLGAFAFDGCDSLEAISFPDSVTTIELCAFRYCHKLTSIRLPPGLSEINDGVFNNCESLTSVLIPGNLRSIRQSAFEGCVNLTDLVIPESLEEIGYAAFKGCANLAGLIIPDSVSFIDEKAFEGCENLVLQVDEGSYAKQYAAENGIAYEVIVK